MKQLMYLIIDVTHKRSKSLAPQQSKLKTDPNKYILKLSDEPKNTRIDPEFVKQLIYLIHPSCTRHQNSQLNCSTRAKPINKLKIDPHRYNSYFRRTQEHYKLSRTCEARNIFDVPLLNKR